MAVSKLLIAPIGTCRIHGPLRKGVPRYPVEAHTSRNYGFVHSSAEVLQQLRFMFGTQSVPAHIQRLTFRPDMSTAELEKPYVPADVYVVELSSRKLLTADGYPIQANYTGRYFGDFFADRNRARTFWSMASVEQHAERRAWLDTDPVFRRLSADDRDLLASIFRRVQPDAEVEREMGEIAEIVGKDKLVFVTHVDARTPDGNLIEQRHELIELVKSRTERLGVRCYDPTLAMLELGQANALEQGGRDLTHYTPEFSERLFDDWYVNYLIQRIGPSAPLPIRSRVDPVTAIEAAWSAGDLCGASRRVHAVLRANPAQAGHRMLLARMQSELGDYESAIAHAERSRSESGTTEQADEILMRCNFELGRYAQAYGIAAGLLRGEHETAEILRICALSATRIEERETAIVNWKRFFRLSQDSVEAASAVLELLEASGDEEAVGEWANEVRDALPSHAPSYAVQWKLGVASGNRSALRALAGNAPDLDDQLLLSLASLASSEGFALAAAGLIEAQDADNRNAEVAQWIATQMPQWLLDAERALERNDLLVAVDRIGASCLLDPTNRPAMRAEWTLEKRLQKDVRAAFNERNHQWLADLVDSVAEARLSFPEMDMYRGRAAEALGDVNAAVNYLRRAADQPGAPISARLYLARVAARSDCYKAALEAFEQLASDRHADQAVQNEALRQLGIVRTRCVRAARELNARGAHCEAWALLDLIGGEIDVASERKRVLSSLHARLRLVDSSEASARIAIARTILGLAPGDQVALKAAAVAAMRLQRYTEALPRWQALRRSSENADYIESNIKRCETLIARANRPARAAPRTLVPSD
ncbi:hypothetical protein AWB80_06074 [Caballeronia pedi]|uniref:Tetratricopeptide repeat protein n=1 Tax=Caballeronia pedi TaxID=1777141 RepID=A0A158CZX9_9BURK|nr:hypothetical protein [Caballeronia pedi]SAK87650.1 hypothetical protein AWB80_06074 [Caballeronia pedi]